MCAFLMQLFGVVHNTGDCGEHILEIEILVHPVFNSTDFIATLLVQRNYHPFCDFIFFGVRHQPVS